jgi:hypothetical protein
LGIGKPLFAAILFPDEDRFQHPDEKFADGSEEEHGANLRF